MNYRKTLLAASIITCLGVSNALYAQDSDQSNTSTTSTTTTPPPKKQIQTLSTVKVTGIRSSEAESLALKKDANVHVEIVTAEDIGKLPAKNVADTLARLPGVNISDAGGAEGGFDEADRVSLRGTSPSLTLTTVNGHTIGTGDWFVLSESNGRSVSYSMLPSEVVSEVEVYKTSEAKLQEGGATGTVNIITRKPLEFDKQVTGEATFGGVYSDLPSTTKPQFNGLFNWKNDDNTFGVMLQAFDEERSLQRDGQETLGYSVISSTSALAKAHPDLAGVYYPNLPGAALFTQTRKRKGGVIDLEWKPLDNLTLDLNGFYSKLDATDYNRNYMLWNTGFIPTTAAATGLQSYTVKNNVLTNASFAGVTGGTPGVYDQISRPGESESSYYITLDADWKVTDLLNFKGEVGATRGTGNTPTQDVMEMDTGVGQSSSWGLNGISTPANWALGGNNSAYNTTSDSLNWIFGEQDLHVIDKEQWGQLDGEYNFDDAGPLSSLDFGARYSSHTRESLTAIGQGALGTVWSVGEFPASYSNYPSSFASALGVGSMPSNIWYWTPGQLAALDKLYANRDAVARLDPSQLYRINEKNSALYFQVNFSSDRWSGNVGLRYVYTKENIGYTSASALETDYSGPYLGSAFEPDGWYWNYYHKSYSKVLPSFNLKFNLSEDGSVLARFAASQTMTRQDYNALAGAVTLSDPVITGVQGTGTGSNPYLKPLISTNFDASLEWYFSPRGLLSLSAFEMNLHNYTDWGATNTNYVNQYLTHETGVTTISNYEVGIPVNVDGNVKGVELNYIQPIGEHFGVQTNFTYTNGHETGGTLLYTADGGAGTGQAAGDRPLMGNSKKTASLSGYYEDQHWNGRISYTYRSSFYDGFASTTNFLEPYYQEGVGSLSLSAGYKVNNWLSFAFNAMNLNNPKLKYYTNGSAVGLNYGNEPYAMYTNGRQYYLTATFKF